MADSNLRTKVMEVSSLNRRVYFSPSTRTAIARILDLGATIPIGFRYNPRVRGSELDAEAIHHDWYIAGQRLQEAIAPQDREVASSR